MALPFLLSQAKRRDQILAIDPGARVTKAVHIQRKGESFILVRYALQEAPDYEKGFSPEAFSEHLKRVAHEVGARTKVVALALGVNDSVLRHADLPLVPVGDMRTMLKFNSKNYLQQDLTDHVFDCFVLPPRDAGPAKPEAARGSQKCRVLVCAAKRKLVDDVQAAARAAGLSAEVVVPSLICGPNAFEIALPEVFSREVVALVDIGFRSSTITMLLNGELILTRVVAIGGDRLTTGLAETLNTSYAEAEGIKVGMPTEVQSNLEGLISPLGRELRASIDFFEHQQDKTVTQVYLSGGSARSEFIVQCLQNELMVQCKRWNPAGSLALALPPQQMGELEQVAPQLTVAIGAAMATF